MRGEVIRMNFCASCGRPNRGEGVDWLCSACLRVLEHPFYCEHCEDRGCGQCEYQPSEDDMTKMAEGR